MTINAYTAPEGFGELSKGIVYHRIRNDRQIGLVYLASFKKEGRKAELTVLTREAYESGLVAQAIVPFGSNRSLPPWLSELEGMNLSLLDGRRHKMRRSHLDLVEKRLALIKPLVDSQQEIFSARDPIAAINRFARLATPKQNETRMRTWFLVYMAHGQNMWSLLPPYHLNGLWDRSEKVNQKFGRKHKEGGRHGYSCNEAMIKRILNCFHRFCMPGRSMREIYACGMTHEFGCMTVREEGELVAYMHPEGLPFPSENQFRYWCQKRLGIEHIQRTLYGEQRFRNRLQLAEGSYARSVANLMEKVEGDAYSSKEHPTSFTTDKPSPKLFVVRLRCVASGPIVGIGFSHGSERSVAYRTALFCAAVDKREFCRLFGLDVAAERWTTEGLPMGFGPDRGAGGSQGLVDLLMEHTAIVELPPSHTPQSHATIEASHPRDVHIEGAPRHSVSALNAVGMARREIYEALLFNESSSAASRMTVDMVRKGIMPTPLGVWNYLNARGRSDAQPMAFDDAVRTFLSPVEFTLVDGQLNFKKMTYDSPALRQALRAARLGKGASTCLRGYAMEMCVRHTWVEVGCRLIEVDAHLPIRDDQRQLYLSLPELEEYEEGKRRARRQNDAGRAPARSAMIEESEKMIGPAAASSRTVRGRAKAKTPTAVREVNFLRHDTRGGR
jgi:hypothetical protein